MASSLASAPAPAASQANAPVVNASLMGTPATTAGLTGTPAGITSNATSVTGPVATAGAGPVAVDPAAAMAAAQAQGGGDGSTLTLAHAGKVVGLNLLLGLASSPQVGSVPPATGTTNGAAVPVPTDKSATAATATATPAASPAPAGTAAGSKDPTKPAGATDPLPGLLDPTAAKVLGQTPGTAVGAGTGPGGLGDLAQQLPPSPAWAASPDEPELRALQPVAGSGVIPLAAAELPIPAPEPTTLVIFGGLALLGLRRLGRGAT